MIRASRSRFTPDALSALYPAGVDNPGNLTDDTYTNGFAIDQLSSYWNSAGDLAMPQEVLIVFKLGVLPGHYGETYTFELVTDDAADLSDSPAVISTATVAVDTPTVMEYVVAREQLNGTSDTYIGLHGTMTDGYPVGYIAFSGAAAAGDEVDLDDEHYKTRDVVISGTLTADDTIIVDDGTSSPVTFVCKNSGAVIANHEFNKGASASDSAQNFKAAVAYAVTAGDLVDVFVSGGAATITVKYPTGGSVAEGVDSGSKIAVGSETPVDTALIFGDYDAGQLVYSGVMTDGDGVTIDDGIHDAVTFTFKDNPGLFGSTLEVAVGSTATDSAQNLKAAIEYQVYLGNLSVTVAGASTTLDITNTAVTEAGFVSLTGSITEEADVGTKQAVTSFTGGGSGIATGATAAESAANLMAAVNAGSYSNANVTAFELNATTVGIVNYGATVAVNSGSLTEDTDSGNVMTVTDFAVPTAALDFWAYMAPVCAY